MNKIEIIKKQVKPILEKHHIKKASLFGSLARGEEKKNSDADFLVQFPLNYGGLFAMARLKRDLEKTLKRKVDLSTYKAINPLIRKHINKDKIIIYER